MKSLWFKDEFVSAILAGEKTETTRKRSPRLPAVGERVQLSVGARRPFATATIAKREELVWNRLTPEKRAELTAIGIDSTAGPLTRLHFADVQPASAKGGRHG